MQYSHHHPFLCFLLLFCVLSTCFVVATQHAYAVCNSTSNSLAVANTYDKTKTAQTVTFKTSVKNMGVGGFITLKATTNGDGSITYSSSNTSVATISGTGNVNAIQPGTTNITAEASSTSRYAKGSATFKLTVKQLFDNEQVAAVTLAAIDVGLAINLNREIPLGTVIDLVFGTDYTVHIPKLDYCLNAIVDYARTYNKPIHYASAMINAMNAGGADTSSICSWAKSHTDLSEICPWVNSGGIIITGNTYTVCPFCGSTNIDNGDWGDWNGNWDPRIWGCYDCWNRWG